MSKTPDRMRCSHILLSWDKAVNSTHTRELSFAIHDAKTLIAELKRGGISWDVAVKENSACVDSFLRGGDLGWFQQHEITPELWIACLVTPVGELNPEPVQSPYGIHIIFRTG